MLLIREKVNEAEKINTNHWGNNKRWFTRDGLCTHNGHESCAISFSSLSLCLAIFFLFPFSLSLSLSLSPSPCVSVPSHSEFMSLAPNHRHEKKACNLRCVFIFQVNGDLCLLCEDRSHQHTHTHTQASKWKEKCPQSLEQSFSLLSLCHMLHWLHCRRFYSLFTVSPTQNVLDKTLPFFLFLSLSSRVARYFFTQLCRVNYFQKI